MKENLNLKSEKILESCSIFSSRTSLSWFITVSVDDDLYIFWLFYLTKLSTKKFVSFSSAPVSAVYSSWLNDSWGWPSFVGISALMKESGRWETQKSHQTNKTFSGLQSTGRISIVCRDQVSYVPTFIQK